jgi:isoleucyl-tRNA synthetase
MFKPVSPKLDVTALEESVLKFWKSQKIFEKTISERKGAPEYVFFEGPRAPSRTCSRATRS